MHSLARPALHFISYLNRQRSLADATITQHHQLVQRHLAVRHGGGGWWAAKVENAEVEKRPGRGVMSSSVTDPRQATRLSYSVAVHGDGIQQREQSQ